MHRDLENNVVLLLLIKNRKRAMLKTCLLSLTIHLVKECFSANSSIVWMILSIFPVVVYSNTFIKIVQNAFYCIAIRPFSKRFIVFHFFTSHQSSNVHAIIFAAAIILSTSYIFVWIMRYFRFSWAKYYRWYTCDLCK